jgi:hypothetical protein
MQDLLTFGTIARASRTMSDIRLGQIVLVSVIHLRINDHSIPADFPRRSGHPR